MVYRLKGFVITTSRQIVASPYGISSSKGQPNTLSDVSGYDLGQSGYENAIIIYFVAGLLRIGLLFKVSHLGSFPIIDKLGCITPVPMTSSGQRNL